MDDTLYVAFSALQAEVTALSVAANNLANVNTNGYREERSFIAALEIAGASYPRVAGTETSSKPGPLLATGRDLDVAIEGEGYLVIQTPEGRRYTRDGGLSLDEDGQLVNRAGHAVLGQGGPIRVPPGKADIDTEGRVMVSGAQAGRILLVELEADSVTREQGGLYRSSSEETPATEGRLRQGFVEKSNVNLPSGNLNQVQNHFQSVSRAIQVMRGLDRQLITAARSQ